MRIVVRGLAAAGVAIALAACAGPSQTPVASVSPAARTASQASAPSATSATASPSPTPDPMEVALALARAGYDDEARTNAKKAIEADPSRVLPPGLRYLNGEPFPVLTEIPDVMRQATLFLDGVLLLAGIAAVLLVAIHLTRRAVEPVVEIEDLGDDPSGAKVGKALSALIKEELDFLRQEGAGGSVMYAHAIDAQVKIPDAILALGAQFKVLAALLDLLPRRVVQVAGQLHPKCELGVGLTISVDDPLGVRAGRTIWEKDVDPAFRVNEARPAPTSGDKDKKGADREQPGGAASGKSASAEMDPATYSVYRRLAVAAAAWLVYQLPISDRRSLTDVTPSALSYERFRTAVTWKDDGDPDRARDLYVGSLQHDPRNTATLVNLGAMDGWEKRPPDFARAASRLALAQEEIVKRSKAGADSRGFDRLWCRASYDLAASRFHEFLEAPARGAGEDDFIGSARSTASDLIVACTKAILQIDSSRRLPRLFWSEQASAPTLRAFVLSVRDATAVLLADILARGGDTSTAFPTSWETLIGDLAANPHLYPSPDRLIDLVAGPEMNTAVGPRRPGAIKLSYRVRYNLACYYAGRGDYPAALEELRFGLESSGDLRRWVLEDPSLAGLRKDRTFGPQVTALAIQGGVPQGRLGTGAIAIEHAAILAKHGITELWHLVERIRSSGGAARLADELGVDAIVVAEWSQFAMSAMNAGVTEQRIDLLLSRDAPRSGGSL